MADKKSEEYELDRLGAMPTKNSGRGKFQKGDGVLSYRGITVTVDVKEYKESFGLSRKMVAKLGADTRQNRTDYGIFFVVLGEEEPRQRMVVMTEQMFNDLTDDMKWDENDD